MGSFSQTAYAFGFNIGQVKEFGPITELEQRDKADNWLYDVRSQLEEQSDFDFIDPSDTKFLQQTERGLDLSERRVAILAELLDRREAFFAEHGADIILEQYYVFKFLMDKSAAVPGE